MAAEMNPGSAQSVQELWAHEADERVRYGKGFHWVESPIVNAYIQEQITGNPNVGWGNYIYQKYVQGRTPPANRILSLGCGGGALERDLCRLGFRGRIDACDFSEGAVDHARTTAVQEGLENIHYFISDLNQAEFAPETYDIVFSGSALHHISNLEHLLDQARGTLIEHGLLIINEYVGPFQLQWTPQQTRIIDELLHLLPPKYRKRASAPETFKDSFSGPASIRDMDAADPSEAIRSDEIIPLIQARFSIKEHKNFGGTILHMLLQDIVGNFDPTNTIDAGFLNLLIYIERLLIREKILPSDFVLLVAEKSQRFHAQPKDYPTDLVSELRAREVRIQNMQERLLQLQESTQADHRVHLRETQSMQERLRQLENYVRDLETHLQELTGTPSPAPTGDGGAAWQLVVRFRQWKECKLLMGSRRRKVYDALMGWVRRRLTARHETS